MTRENHETIIELIPAYALGALEPDEARRVSDHLHGCVPCQRELTAYSAMLGELALAMRAPAPSAQLQARVRALAGEMHPEPPGVSRHETWPSRLRAWLAPRPWQPLLAVLLVLLVAGIALVAQLEAPTNPAQFALENTAAAPGAGGVIEAESGSRSGVLRVSNLPVLDTDQQYQLWLIADGERVSGAIFSVAADGAIQVTIEGRQPLESYDAFGITIEPAGGSPGPTGPRVLGWNL